MTLNKNKIVVSALALVIAGSLVGSISGTIAWYQYSTRANVSFIGEAGGISGNLQMRFISENADDDAWRTRITWQEINNELALNHSAEKIVPMTFGAMEKDAALPAKGYVQPDLGIANMAKWYEASSKNYAQFQLQLRQVERNADEEKNVEKDVYISRLAIQEHYTNDANNKEDLSDAVRVHISSVYGGEHFTQEEIDVAQQGDAAYGKTVNDYKVPQNKNYKLISNNGGRIDVNGLLDLDNDGHADRAYPEADLFGFKDQNGETLQAVYYGEGTQNSYANAVDFVAGTKWTQGELDAAALVAGAYHKSVDDLKVEGVHFTQDEIDAAVEGDDAYGKTVADWKVAPEYWQQDEIDLANAAHGKTVDDYKVDPVHPVLTGVDGAMTSLDYDDDADDATPKLSKMIGQTMESETEYLTVTVTIWVEGWQKLDGSAIWDAVKYIDSQFDVGIQFAVQDALAE